MRKKLASALVFAFLLLPALAASAQATSVSLQNQEDAWFFFVLDPPELQGLPPGSPLVASRVADFFAKETDEFPFTALKPRAGLTLESLREGPHFLVGFFTPEGRGTYPVRVLTLQVDRRLGQRFYGIYSEPPLLTLPRGVGRLAGLEDGSAAPRSYPSRSAEKPMEKTQAPAKEQTAAAPPAKEQTAETPPVKTPAAAEKPEPAEIARFGQGFSPEAFSREAGGAFALLPIGESRYWNREGTRLASLAGYKSGESLVLDIASATRFSADVSYFLYFFGDRTLGKDNKVTLEVKPLVEGSARGLAALWVQGAPEPRAVGAVSVTGATCRLQLDEAELPAALLSAAGGNPTVDLTACYFDAPARTYEEFPYATFSLADLPGFTR